MERVNEVELHNVTRRFGDVLAVDRVSLDVKRSEFLTLLGPSGCGKTTLLRMIGGFVAPDEGSIILGGLDVTDLPPFRRDVTTVFQQYALFPHMSVFANVAFGLERMGASPSEIARRVGEALEMVRLAGMDSRRPAELSGGQQQRVALARALVVEPRVLLLDEPLAALDLKLRKEMQVELKGLQRRVGISFIYVTHDQEEALTMSDRIVVMDAGRVEQIGSASEIYEQPANEFVAGFIGVSNTVEGEVQTNSEGEAFLVVGRSKIRMPNNGVEPGKLVRLMVRPEKIVLGEPDLAEGLSGRIESAVYLGESTQWIVEIEGGQRLTVFQQNIEAFSSARGRIGQEVSLSWAADAAVILRK